MTSDDGPHPDTSLDAISPEDKIDEELFAEHHSIDADARARLFERDAYRCQANGCLGLQRGGSARLLAQRIQVPQSETITDDLEGLVTHCYHCARWLSQLPGRDTLRPALRDRLNGVEIQTTWAEILQSLDQEGPGSPAEIRGHVSLGSKGGVRKAIYRLMQLDIEHDDIESQLVVKDRQADVYGLPRHIPPETRARGTIPLDPDRRQTRLLDEVVRLLDAALAEVSNRVLDELVADAGIDDNAVAPAVDQAIDEAADDIIASCVGRDPQQLRIMRVRADAFQFPFAEWADSTRPRADERAAIDAVDALAGATDNISRPLLSDVLAEAFESHEEPQIAELLDDWTWASDRSGRQATLTDTVHTGNEDHSPSECLDRGTVGANQRSPGDSDGSTRADVSTSESDPEGGHLDESQGPRVDSLTPDADWPSADLPTDQRGGLDGETDDD